MKTFLSRASLLLLLFLISLLADPLLPTSRVTAQTNTPSTETTTPNIEIKTESIAIMESLQLNLPSVTLLPGSPLYQLKTTVEQIQLFFTRDPKDRAQLLLDLGEKRLAEALALFQDNKPNLAQGALVEFDRLLTEAENLIPDIEQGSDVAGVRNIIKAQEEKVSMFNLATGEYNIKWQR